MRVSGVLGLLLMGGLLFGGLGAYHWVMAASATKTSCWTPWDDDVDEKSWSATTFVWAGVQAKVLVCNGHFIQIIPDPNHKPPSPNFVTEAQGVRVLEKNTYVKGDLSEAGAWVTYIDPTTGKRSQVYAKIPHIWPKAGG
ncbi:hypothetical protein [Thermococcus henrietii]|uniref:hypothetical protein n=1 Tax=Thermococcus henrietii TaxID=2016361 RepID=UPI000C07EBD8|nr:hypothetical protein [Thermococcus henrietii]